LCGCETRYFSLRVEPD